LVCTRVYSNLSTKMAMKIGSQYQATQVYPRHWEQLSKEIHYRYPALIKLINKQAQQIQIAMHEVRSDFVNQFGESKIINEIIIWVEKNLENVQRLAKN